MVLLRVEIAYLVNSSLHIGEKRAYVSEVHLESARPSKLPHRKNRAARGKLFLPVLTSLRLFVASSTIRSQSRKRSDPERLFPAPASADSMPVDAHPQRRTISRRPKRRRLSPRSILTQQFDGVSLPSTLRSQGSNLACALRQWFRRRRDNGTLIGILALRPDRKLFDQCIEFSVNFPEHVNRHVVGGGHGQPQSISIH